MGLLKSLGGIVGSVAGGVIAGAGAKKAAKAQLQAQREAIAEQRRQFDVTRQDMQPWRDTGVNALGRLDRASTGSMGDFYRSPDYNFRRNEGMRGLERSAASRGGAFSGNALRELAKFNSNLAAGEYGDWWNRQAGLAGVGQTATNNLATLGANTASNIANLTMAGGDARASGVISSRNALAGGINDALSLWYRSRAPGMDYGAMGDSISRVKIPSISLFGG